MLKNRLYCTLAVAALVGVAACGGDDEGAVMDEGQVTDTLVTTDTVTREIQVAVPDTQAVITDVDTTRDTVNIGGQPQQ